MITIATKLAVLLLQIDMITMATKSAVLLINIVNTKYFIDDVYNECIQKISLYV